MNAQEYIIAATARSFRNRGDALASPAEELLGVLTRQFFGYYAEAADQNPSVFAKRANVAWNVGGYWEVPSDQYSLYQMTTPTNAKVVVVPFSDLKAEPSEAAVYRLASRYYPAGNPNDPTNVTLTFIYQPVPPVFNDLTDSPPSDWPEQFDERVIADLAVYLAEKDGRPEDIAAFAEEANKWKALYDRWLGIADVNTIRRFSLPTQVPTPQVQNIGVRG